MTQHTFENIMKHQLAKCATILHTKRQEYASEVDAVPVVRGEWVEAKSGVMSVWPPGQVMCSVCGQGMPSQWKKMPPYCYGCGAKMESEGST